MILNFCAVCGKTEDLQQHHIEPVVFSQISRKKKKRYDGDKKLKDCTSMEVFGWLFDQGVITDDGEITVCSYHHNIMHGILKFQKAEAGKLVREGQAKARAKGVKFGRPLIITQEIKDDIVRLKQEGVGIKKIASIKDVGISTVYSAIQGLQNQKMTELIKEKECPMCNTKHQNRSNFCSKECSEKKQKESLQKAQKKLKELRELGLVKMGRPIIITEELKEGIRKDRASGMGATKIARKYGIGVSTVYAHSQNLAS